MSFQALPTNRQGPPAWRSGGRSRCKAAPIPAQASAATLGDEAAARRQPTSTSAPARPDGMQQRSGWPLRRQEQNVTTNWESGYNSDAQGGGLLKFLDMEQMAATYEETVFPAAKDPDPTQHKLNRHIQKAVWASTSITQLMDVVGRDAALMNPDTSVVAMKALADCWLHTQDKQQQQQQQQQGDRAAAAGPGQEDVDAGMGLLVTQLATDLSKVRLTHVASAIHHLGRASFRLPAQPGLQEAAPSPTALPLSRFRPSPPLESPSPSPSISSSLASLLSHCQPDLFLASPEELSRLVQGLGQLQLRQQRQQTGGRGRAAAGEAQAGGGGVRVLLPPGWLQAMCKVSQSKFLAMDAQQLSSVGWAVMQLGQLPDPFWVSSFIARTWACIQQASPSTLAQLAWVLMFMNRAATTDTRWMQQYQQYNSLWEVGSIATPAAPQQQQQQQQQRQGAMLPSNPSPSPSASCIVGPEWPAALWEAVREELGSMRAPRFAQLVHALSLLGLRLEPEEWGRVVAFLEQQGEGLTPMQDCQILCSLARWKGHLPPSSMLSYMSHTQRRLVHYSPADLHHMLWALSNLGPLPFLPPQPWLAHWMQCARPQLRLFGPGGIVTLIKAFSIWQLCPPREFVQDVLEVCAGLARARMFTPCQLSRVIRGVTDLRIPLLPDMDRPPRWSREVLTAFASSAAAAGPKDLALVCFCLPHLLRPAPPGREGGEQGNAAGKAEADAPPRPAPARQAAMHALTLPVVRSIADAAAGCFSSMSGVQLRGVAVGLARVHFPASPAWMDAHARALAGRLVEVQEGQLEEVEQAYARMRRCGIRAARMEGEGWAAEGAGREG